MCVREHPVEGRESRYLRFNRNTLGGCYFFSLHLRIIFIICPEPKGPTHLIQKTYNPGRSIF